MAMASSYFSSEFVTLFRGSFKCAAAFQRFSLYLISGIDVTKEGRRHLNTMQLQNAPSSCPMVEEPKEAKMVRVQTYAIGRSGGKESIISFGINV
jgi:hypothetical protein